MTDYRAEEADTDRRADEPIIMSIRAPVYRSRLSIEHDAIVIESIRARPNAWFRFWYRVLLGWKWEKIEGGR